MNAKGVPSQSPGFGEPWVCHEKIGTPMGFCRRLAHDWLNPFGVHDLPIGRLTFFATWTVKPFGFRSHQVCFILRVQMKLFKRGIIASLAAFAAGITASRAEDWPMFRADAARSGYTAEAIPNQLALRWVFRSKHEPKPAWPTSERIHFDRAFQPIIMGDLVIFGSSADDKVYAVDAASGAERWTFFTGAPVRFAPAGWRDRIFVASDDGWLYSLALEDGRLLWKHRGGPDHRSVIGNERIISQWPARGGPVVSGDIVYFSAGVWPSDGVYLHALNAATGEQVWSNGETGTLLMAQPHGGANATSGVSAQGYLLATDENILVPTGRAVPAAFDRRDGKLLYYHLQKNQHRGGSRAMAVDRFFLNDGCLFDLQSGDLSSQIGNGAAVALPDGLVRSNGRSLVAYGWMNAQIVDRKGAPLEIRRPEENRLISTDREVLEFIVAGGDAICGEDARVSAIDYARQRTVWWSHQVEGKALGLAAANGRVVVSTDKGVIYCFDGEPEPVQGPAPSRIPVAESNRAGGGRIDYAAAAEEILDRSEIREGFCVDLDAGTGELAMELAKRSNLHIYAVTTDADNTAAARRALAAAGIYGSRVTVHQEDPERVSYPDYFANLVVSSRSLTNDVAPGIASEMRRLQRPGGGKKCLGRPGSMEVAERAALAGSGSWTHQNSNPGNTLCSDDAVVKGPLSMFWFRDVEFEIPNRHGQGPAPLFHNGFLVVGGVDGICCLDAYNGRIAWIFPIPGHLADYDGIHHDVGVAETGSTFCIGENEVFVRHKDRCYRVDLATGELMNEFKTPVREGDADRNWGYLAWSDGTLYGSVLNQEHSVSPRYKLTGLRTESVLFFAMDAATGRLKWQHTPAESIRNNAIAVGAGRVFLVDRPLVADDRITRPERDGKHRPAMMPGQVPPGRLVALDAKSGEEIWRNEDGIFGTQLAVSAPHSVLVMNYQAVRHSFFKLPSEIGDRLAGFDLRTGKRIWDQEGKYQTRPVINDDKIYAQGGAWNLMTGEPLAFALDRSYGCGQISSGKHLMLFRSATLGYLDLSRESETENYGGIRPSCWINAIPAGGLVLVPDGSSKCRCSYQMRAWFALQPER